MMCGLVCYAIVYGMVWYGMVWYVTVRYGMVYDLYGVVFYDILTIFYFVLHPDKTPPVISNCPADQTEITDYGFVPISWTEPTFSDNVGITNKLQTKTSGSQFKRGTTTTVYYIIFDAAGNSVNCSFTVTIKRESLFLLCIYGRAFFLGFVDNLFI